MTVSQKLDQLSTVKKECQNASSRIDTVKIYPAFAPASAKAVVSVSKRSRDYRTDGKNLSPLFRLYVNGFYGFEQSRSQLNRLMSRPGVMTSIMAESAHIRHFKSLKGQRKILCLTAYSTSISHALEPHYGLLLVGNTVAIVVNVTDTNQDADINMLSRRGQVVTRRRQNAVGNEIFSLKQHLC